MVRFQSWLRYSLILFVLALVSGCGGGSGGASSGGGSLSYTGATAPARITYLNAEELAISAFEGGASSGTGLRKSQSSSQGLNPEDPNAFAISRSLRQVLNVHEWKPARASAARAGASGTIQGDSSCAGGPGSAGFTMDFFVEETPYGYVLYKGKGVLTYSGFCSKGARLTGSADISALYDDQTLLLMELTVAFNLLRVETGTASTVASGSIREYNFRDTSYNEETTLFVLDTASSKVFKTDGLITINSPGSDYVDITVSGGFFYHPDYGYVHLLTSNPMRYYDDFALPSSGSLHLSGDTGTRADLTFYPSDNYRVRAYTGAGDPYSGPYDYDTGVKNRGETNTPCIAPTADAGADQAGYTGSPSTLDGSASVSPNGNLLTYSWTIVQAPPGAAAVLANRDTAAPSFTPSVEGSYVIALVVNNGCFSSQTDTVTVNVTLGYVPLFSAYRSIPTGSRPEAVAIADLNGDGRNDVALVTSYFVDPQNDYRVNVFLQSASGGLEQAVKYEVVNGRPSSLVAGDVNGDGRDDVLVGTDTGITVFLQDGAGALVLSSFYPTSNARMLTLGDFNNDGRLDVAGIGSALGYNVELRLQTGSGGFLAPVEYSLAYPFHVMIVSGDVNNDGLTDIAVAYSSHLGKGLVTLAQDNAGALGPPSYMHTQAVDIYFSLLNGLAVGDVNGDSRNDMVFTYGGNRYTSQIGVFLQNAQGGMGQQTDYPAFDIPTPVVIADVNSDGRGDVLVAHVGANSLTVYCQKADGLLDSYQRYSIPSLYSRNPQGMSVGDINSDGKNDVVIANDNYGLLVLYNSH